MNQQTGEIIRVPEGQEPPQGFVKLTDAELIELEMVSKEERPALKAWLESCKKRGIKWHSKMEMAKAKRNFYHGYEAAKEIYGNRG